MKRFVCALWALLLAAALAGCGKSTGAVSSSAPTMDVNGAMDYAPTVGEKMEASSEAAEAAPEEAGSMAMPQNRKIIRRMSLNLETQEFENALPRLRQAVAQAGGYIEQENVNGRSIRQRGEMPRSAYLMARVPTQALDGVVSSVSGLCNVVERRESTDDVTERYYDAEAHLRSLRVQEERLLAILEKADKLEDVVSLEQALSEVRYEIDSITAALQHMDSQVAYSYLEMTLDEVAAYTEAVEMPRTFGQELAAAASVSMNRVGSFSKELLLGLVRNGPLFLLQLVVFGGIAVLIWMAVRWLRRKTGKGMGTRGLRKRNRKTQAQPVADAQPEDNEPNP